MIILAPMEGVVDPAMRDLLTGLGGIDRCVTEFLRVSQRLLPPKVFHRICPELRLGGATPSGTPVYLQLLGSEPQVVAENAARGAELGAPGIDLNFGCPAKTVNNSSGGAVLLREPQRVHDIVAATRGAVPAAIPVTVKIRLGFDDTATFREIVAGIAAAGANELTIHARTKRQGYRPPAHWERIAEARSLTDLAINANGEIWSVDDARRCRAVSGCQRLMLGRGALCRPDLPGLIAAADRGERVEPLGWAAIVPLLGRFLALNLASYDARYAGNPLKQWLVYLRGDYYQAHGLFDRVKRLHEPEAIQGELDLEAARLGVTRRAA